VDSSTIGLIAAVGWTVERLCRIAQRRCAELQNRVRLRGSWASWQCARAGSTGFEQLHVTGGRGEPYSESLFLRRACRWVQTTLVYTTAMLEYETGRMRETVSPLRC